jgi:sugar phosphate isomerase/epimerase
MGNKKFRKRYGACLPTFGSCADRYCLSGYGGGGTTLEEMFDLAATVEGLQGIELVGNWHINDDNADQIKKILKDRNLSASMVTPDLWTQEKWGRGSFTSRDPAIRKASVKEVTKSMDWAASLGCSYVDVWPGQDGYDYCFQSDYLEDKKRLADGIRECAGYRDDVKVLIEYKPKEPRTHLYVARAADLMLLLDEIGSDNVGALLDIGHSLPGGENPAEAVALLNSRTKTRLDYVHLNDNWRMWDDDMMFGSVHIIESLEFLYWLERTGYDGWYTLDIFPYREDGVKAARESIGWVEALLDLLKKIGFSRIEEVIRGGDATEASRMIRESLMG